MRPLHPSYLPPMDLQPLLDAATFNSAIEKKIVRQYYEQCDYFVLDFSDKRKRTRGRYHLLVLRRWMNSHTYLRTLTFKQKFSAHLSFCMDCGKYDTGEKMHAAIFNFFEHVRGDHTNCAATCSHAEVEPWQKNPTYKQQVSALKVHMLGKIRMKECARIVGGSKTAVIEALWAHMLTHRPKNIHFSLEGCKARCQCCRLDNNARRDPCAVCAKHAPLGWEGEKRRRFAWREDLMRRHLFVQPPPALCTRSSGAKS